MFMSVCAFSFMDLIVKWSEHYPLGQVLFFRGFFGIVIYFFIMPRDRIKNFYSTKRAGLHFLRCLFGLIALIAIFIALRNLPLATVVSISFAAPIFTTIFSIFFLSEKVGFYRWLAVSIGFHRNYCNNRTWFWGFKHILYLSNYFLSRFILCRYCN